ncbi:MAG: hypothetical protein QOJ70_1763 [Acidobacteriota bacterium]|nr:hypothetical protein [Acidobacteriota bacterium]
MAKPNPSKSVTCAVFVLLLLAMAFCAQAAAARAQSGRKAQKTSTTPTAEATPTQGESESGPKQGAKKTTDVLVSFVVMYYDDQTSFGIDPRARDGVLASFVQRLGQSVSVSVTDAGRGRRQEARERAKSESSAFVVLFELEDEAATTGRGSVGQVNTGGLIIRTYVYTPKTADLKYTDTIYQRPYRQTARIGGVRVPVPTRGIERYPSQHELEQAARDAADRLLTRFHITPPPDN